MTRISQMAAARPQGRSADSPTNSVPAIPADRLRAIFETHRVVVDDRPDLTEQLRQGEHTGPTARPVVTLGAKVLVGAVWIACAAYCVAICMGVAA